MPGTEWPEKFLLTTIKEHATAREELFEIWKVDKDYDDEIIYWAIRAGKHKALHNLAEQLNQDEEQVKIDVIRMVGRIISEEVQSMEKSIKVLLGC